MNKVNKYTFRPYVVFIVFLGLLLLPGTFCFLYICLFHTNTLNIYGKIAAYLMCIGMICVDVYMVLACRCKVKLSVEGIEIFNAGKCKYYTAKWTEFAQISFVHDWSGHMHMIISKRAYNEKEKRKIANQNSWAFFVCADEDVIIFVNKWNISRIINALDGVIPIVGRPGDGSSKT